MLRGAAFHLFITCLKTAHGTQAWNQLMFCSGGNFLPCSEDFGAEFSRAHVVLCGNVTSCFLVGFSVILSALCTCCNHISHLGLHNWEWGCVRGRIPQKEGGLSVRPSALPWPLPHTPEFSPVWWESSWNQQLESCRSRAWRCDSSAGIRIFLVQILWIEVNDGVSDESDLQACHPALIRENCSDRVC